MRSAKLEEGCEVSAGIPPVAQFRALVMFRAWPGGSAVPGLVMRPWLTPDGMSHVESMRSLGWDCVATLRGCSGGPTPHSLSALTAPFGAPVYPGGIRRALRPAWRSTPPEPIVRRRPKVAGPARPCRCGAVRGQKKGPAR